MRKPNSARLGIVWTTFAKPRTGRARRGRRVRAMPSGTPIDDGEERRNENEDEVLAR